MKIGVLHPGAMGATVVQALVGNGHEVYWCSESRSAQTRQRAEAANARDCASLQKLCGIAQTIISVCPPESATVLAQQVADADFTGLYADLNAIAPERAAQIAQLFPNRYVDGGVIGPPALRAGTTRLYLSGARAGEVQRLFAQSPLEVVLLTGADTAASALKMCYASWTKGQAALLLNSLALADALGVGDSLESEWARSQAGTYARAEASIVGTGPKAWRFVGEMNEIAATFAAADLPDGFHQGAADFYQRLASFKDKSGITLSDMLDVLGTTRKSD